MRLTASRLARAEACPPSVALPQIERPSDHAEAGRARHAYCQLAPEIGSEAALAQLPAEHRDACAAIDPAWIPEGHREVSYAWDPDTDTAREIGRGLSRAYPDIGSAIVGTADVVSTGGTHVYDYKTRRSSAGGAGDSLQLAFLALCASRVHGVDDVSVTHIYLDEGGRRDTVVLGADDHDRTADRVRRIVARVETASLVVAAGAQPSVTTGAHCRWCSADCPAKRALAMELAGQTTAQIETQIGQLSREDAGRAVVRIREIRDVLSRADAALRMRSRDAPLLLPDGSLWGPRESQREVIDADVLAAVLAEIAPTVDLTRLEVTKAAIERAAGRAGARRIIDEVRARGGVTVRVSERWEDV